MKKFLTAVTIILVATPSHAWSLFGPKNFDECVLENMKGVTSDEAAIQIMGACSRKFSKKKPTVEDATPKTSSKPSDGICRLVIRGSETKKVDAPPQNWRDTYLAFRVGRHEMHEATIYVPKTFKETKESEKFLADLVSIYCF
jgi:hypothetical protein